MAMGVKQIFASVTGIQKQNWGNHAFSPIDNKTSMIK